MKYLIKYALLWKKFRRSLNPNRISLDNSIERSSKIMKGVSMHGCDISEYVWIGAESRIYLTDVGCYSSIGPRAIIGENEHLTTALSTSEILLNSRELEKVRMINSQRTIISPDVWLGANVIIKKGVKVGVGAVVGAGAVVTKDLPPYAIAVGVPAKVIKYRHDEQTVVALLESEWWMMPKKALTERIKEMRSEGKLRSGDVRKYLVRKKG